MKKQKPTAPDRPIGRQAFRSAMDRGEALAIDPGGAGLIAALRKGVQPSPAAFGFFDASPPIKFVPEAYTTEWGTEVPSSIVDGVAVLGVEGPLEHHESWCWPSYDVILRESTAALECSEVKALVLKLDTPGGVAAGMGETWRALRKLQARTGKAIYAYVAEMACSAGYHLAAACAEVWLPPAGQVGSVGVILCTIDESKALRKAGMSVKYVVSGAYKADLHPGQPVDGGVLARAQSKVDYLFGLFSRAVAKSRGLSPEAVDAMNAAVFHGKDAVDAGLADGVASWPKFFAYVKAVAGATVQKVRATAPGRKAPPSGETKAKAKAMAKLLQLQAALEAAKTAAGTAHKALLAKPGSKSRAKAYEAAVEARALARAALEAKMTKETHTKVTEEESAAESAASSSAASSMESSEESSKSTMRSSGAEEEEEAESSGKSSAESSKKSSMAEEEEGEEEAAAKAWGASNRTYKARMKGIDAYAVHGPKSLLKAVHKALGTTTIPEAIGALAALPKRAKADAAVEKKVQKLEAAGRAQRVAAIVDGAKLEGRAPTKELRAELRALGAEKGTAWLKGYVAKLPKLGRTSAEGPLIPREDAEGKIIGGAPANADQVAMMERAVAGMTAEQREKYLATFAKNLKSSANGAPHKHGAER